MTFSPAEYLVRSSRAAVDLVDDAEVQAKLRCAVDLVVTCLRSNGKILLCGNGGSCAMAAHLAGELVGSFYDRTRPALAAIALTDAAILTAVGNDYGYERTLSRQIAALGRPGDVLVAMTTSGSSPNVLRAIEQALADGLGVVALTGVNGLAEDYRGLIVLRAPSADTPIVQQCHLALGHALIGAVEAEMFPRKG